MTKQGGVREALFSDHNYNLEWGNRLGFAKVATEAKVVRFNSYFCLILTIYFKNVLFS